MTPPDVLGPIGAFASSLHALDIDALTASALAATALMVALVLASAAAGAGLKAVRRLLAARRAAGGLQ
ncbi:MAG: hypothetical protein AAFV51_09140 [Pseudomonadota bacterium]